MSRFISVSKHKPDDVYRSPFAVTFTVFRSPFLMAFVTANG